MKALVVAAALAAFAIPAYAQSSKPAAPGMSPSMSSGKSAATKKAPSTADFVKKATIAGMFEIESSKLAQQKSQDPKVQAFAKMMIDDHTKAADELKSKTQGVSGATMPAKLDAAHQKKLDALKSASGAKFLRQYKSDQVQGHREAVALFQGYSSGGDNADLKSWAGQTLPTLQHHLQEAQNLPTSAAASPTVGSGSSSK
jgi:putative membrane protein